MDLKNSNYPSEITDVNEKSNNDIFEKQFTNFNYPPRATDFVKKSYNAISKKQSVKSYATRVFQESTVGIVSSIVASHSNYRRFFKLLLFSLCVSGFLYQCITFLNHVLEYPAVMDLAVDRSNTYNIPAYTFCINNIILRSEFCRMFPDFCMTPSEEFCKNFSSYCGSKETLIPNKYYRLGDWLTLETLLTRGNREFLLTESHLMRTFNDDKPIGPFLRKNTGSSESMICYSLHSAVENNQQPTKMERTEEDWEFECKTQGPADVLTFYVDESEMMNRRSKPVVLFSLHSPLQFENPFEKGIVLEGGRTYKMYVEMQEEVLLKAPFETNCVDYEELWRQNNHTGPRNQKMCQNKCKLDYLLSVYGCAHHSVLYPSNERNCLQDDFNVATVDRKEKMIRREKCIKSCRNDCRLSKYTTEISLRYQVDSIKEEKNLHRYIKVEIYMPNDGVKIFRHSPKYMTVEVFSSIGGFIGCWLGIALMDILDLFGSIFTVCRYASRK